MSILHSNLDPASEAAKANQAGHAELVAELRARLAAAELGGPEASRDRHVARGKLLPRDRVARLLDEGSPFLEVAPLTYAVVLLLGMIFVSSLYLDIANPIGVK